MAKQTDYLQWHGQQYRVRVRVPAKLQPLLGTAQLIEPLHTADLAEANTRKHAIVGRMKADIALARKALSKTDPLATEALRLRLLHRSHDAASTEAIETRAAAIAETHGGQAGAEFAETARGIFTPLDHHADAFLAHKATYRQKSSGDFRRVLGWLAEWMKEGHRAPFIDMVDRKTAGRFIDESLSRGRSRDKVAAYLGFVREYWKWLKMRGHVEENPWLDQDLPAAARRDPAAEADRGKRPYRTEEIATLIFGQPESRLKPSPIWSRLSFRIDPHSPASGWRGPCPPRACDAAASSPLDKERIPHLRIPRLVAAHRFDVWFARVKPGARPTP